MSVLVAITLDSGSFLPKKKEQHHCDIGYFQSHELTSDVSILIDCEEAQNLPNPFKLGKNCRIEVSHLDAEGNRKPDAVTASVNFHSSLLHLKDLYDQHEPVDEVNFDCVIRFHSGHFRPSMVKPRVFKSHKYKGGRIDSAQSAESKQVNSIAHNVVVHFQLLDGEAIEILRDKETLWSSARSGAKKCIDIEFVADNSTAEKFFCASLRDQNKPSYWLPNQGDPPPMCPSPPCLGTKSA